MIDQSFSTKIVEETRGYGHFIIEPLPTSFGHTLGNALRRTLLSSLEGSAISFVKVNGAPHHFATIKGVKESVLDIVLNLKQLKFQTNGAGRHRVTISIKGAGKVTGKDVEGDATVVNKDAYIAEISDASGKLDIDAIVETGYGFVASEDKEDIEAGFIAVDSAFSPIKKVNFRTEETRVGRKSDFEKLELEIWTDESIMPSEALKKVSQILAKSFSTILSTEEAAVTDETSSVGQTESKTEEVDSKFDDIIIDELNLPSRVINALLRENIETVSDLVKTGRKKLIGLKGVGRKSIDLIDDELKKMGVELQ